MQCLCNSQEMNGFMDGSMLEPSSWLRLGLYCCFFWADKKDEETPNWSMLSGSSKTLGSALVPPTRPVTPRMAPTLLCNALCPSPRATGATLSGMEMLLGTMRLLLVRAAVEVDIADSNMWSDGASKGERDPSKNHKDYRSLSASSNCQYSQSNSF